MATGPRGGANRPVSVTWTLTDKVPTLTPLIPSTREISFSVMLKGAATTNTLQKALAGFDRCRADILTKTAALSKLCKVRYVQLPVSKDPAQLQQRKQELNDIIFTIQTYIVFLLSASKYFTLDGTQPTYQWYHAGRGKEREKLESHSCGLEVVAQLYNLAVAWHAIGALICLEQQNYTDARDWFRKAAGAYREAARRAASASLPNWFTHLLDRLIKLCLTNALHMNYLMKCVQKDTPVQLRGAAKDSSDYYAEMLDHTNEHSRVAFTGRLPEGWQHFFEASQYLMLARAHTHVACYLNKVNKGPEEMMRLKKAKDLLNVARSNSGQIPQAVQELIEGFMASITMYQERHPNIERLPVNEKKVLLQGFKWLPSETSWEPLRLNPVDPFASCGVAPIQHANNVTPHGNPWQKRYEELQQQVADFTLERFLGADATHQNLFDLPDSTLLEFKQNGQIYARTGCLSFFLDSLADAGKNISEGTDLLHTTMRKLNDEASADQQCRNGNNGHMWRKLMDESNKAGLPFRDIHAELTRQWDNLNRDHTKLSGEYQTHEVLSTLEFFDQDTQQIKHVPGLEHDCEQQLKDNLKGLESAHTELKNLFEIFKLVLAELYNQGNTKQCTEQLEQCVPQIEAIIREVRTKVGERETLLHRVEITVNQHNSTILKATKTCAEVDEKLRKLITASRSLLQDIGKFAEAVQQWVDERNSQRADIEQQLQTAPPGSAIAPTSCAQPTGAAAILSKLAPTAQNHAGQSNSFSSFSSTGTVPLPPLTLSDRWWEGKALETVNKMTFDITEEFSGKATAWKETVTTAVLNDQQFDEGNLRMCFKLWMPETPHEEYVAKMGKTINWCEYQVYFGDLYTQAYAAYLATEYNKHNPPKPVCFVEPFLVKLVERDPIPPMEKKALLHCERRLEGEWTRYSNNELFQDQTRNTPMAFSHFTYVHSRGGLIVVDIQGAGDVYSDPQIHSADGMGWGIGNRGQDGIDDFFKQHQCNQICKFLLLPDQLTNPQSQDSGTRIPTHNKRQPRRVSGCQVTMPKLTRLQNAVKPHFMETTTPTTTPHTRFTIQPTLQYTPTSTSSSVAYPKSI